MSDFQGKCFEISQMCSSKGNSPPIVIMNKVIMNKASVYIMFYVNFCYFEKSLWSSSDLLLDIPYLVLRTSIEEPQPQMSNIVICRPKVLRPCYAASIILSLFLLHVYVCFPVIFEKRNKENTWNKEDIPYRR